MEVQNGTGDGSTWLFVYGPALPAPYFVGIAGGPLPTKAYPAVAQDAWLSFDARGTPYFEPATSSLIIRGINDRDAPYGGEKIDSDEYKRWIHDRCAPGRPYDGKLPPHVEGMVYQVTPSQLLAWQVYNSTFGHPSLRSSRRLVPLTVRCFEDADLAKQPSASKGTFVAHTLIASSYSTAPRLQPAWMTQAMHGLALTMPCTQSYAAYIQGLRPFRANHQVAKLVISLFLLPAFALCYAPFAVLRRPIPLYPAWILEKAIAASWWLESWLAPWLGSGCIDL